VTADSTQSSPPSDSSSSPFRTLLTYLTEQYGDAPAAARAQTLLDHLEQQQAAADSTKGSAKRPSKGSESADSTVARSPSKSGAPRDSAVGKGEDSLPSPKTLQRVSDTTRTDANPRREKVRPDTSLAPAQEADSTRRQPAIPQSVPDTTTSGG
jgi:hypothetical protein